MTKRFGVLTFSAILVTAGLGLVGAAQGTAPAKDPQAAKPPEARQVSRAAQDWSSWRGPLNTGVAPQSDPPIEWSETRNVRWKTRLPGPGHASPVVWGNRIYLLSAVPTDRMAELKPEAAPAPEGATAGAEAAPSEEAPVPVPVYRYSVLAVDRETGNIVWQTVVREEAPHESGHETGSQASSSPITDGEHIYAFFGSRGLYCLNAQGKVQWEVDLGDMKTRNQFGEGGTPVLRGDTLVVNWDHEGDSFVVALDKRSGKQLWKVARDERTSWSTPLVIQDDGRDLVVISATNRVRAYDLKTGEEVWAVGGLGANCVPVPVEHDGTLFVMSGYRDPAAMAIRYAGARGDITGSDRVLWRIETGTSYVPSPLLYEGKLYFLERFKAMLSSYDLKTGSAQYEKQRLAELGNIYASPVAAGGRMYLVDRTGSAVVVRLGANFEILAQNKLDDYFDASPAIVGDELILRGHTWLYSLVKDAPPAKPAQG